MTRHACAKEVIAGLTVIALFASSAFAADQIPNVKGKWVGKTHTIVAGAGAHWPSNKGTFEQPGLFEKDLVIEIKGQQDNRFWGNQNSLRQWRDEQRRTDGRRADRAWE